MDNYYYVIKSIRLMSYLIKKDFVLEKVSDDTKNPKYKVFLFADSLLLRNALDEFQKLNK